MPTWTLSNRRNFAALERLGQFAGTGIVLGGDLSRMPSGLGRPERAMAIAEAGARALSLIIETAGSPGGGRGQVKRIWKLMDADSGAYASVFLAHGLAETTARLASSPGHHLSVANQQEARALLRETFPWSDDDEQLVREAADQIQPEDASGLEAAQLSISFVAIAKIVGASAAELPGFANAEGYDADAYLVGVAWQTCFNHALLPFLSLTDPDGLARSGRRER